MSQATTWSAAGSELIGKNVPENRKSGVIPKRKIAANLLGVFWVAEKAAIGVANAIPVKTAAGMASTINGDSAAPNRTMTSVKIEQMSVSRAIIQAMFPSAMSRGEIGVAYMAWNVLLQTSPPMIGKVASNEAACIEVAASRPGARKTRYGTPPSAALDSGETYAPRPIAVRNMTGDRNDVKIDDRKVRRYCRKRCSKTRPAVERGRASDDMTGPTRSASGRSGAGRRPRATTGGRGPSRA